MSMTGIVTDHIEELLHLIVRFTRARRRVLTDNVRRMNLAGFVPQDLAIQEFAEQLHGAIEEHRGHRRLMLRDNQHVRFGPNGRLDLSTETDDRAKGLLASDPPAYLEYQTQRLLENTLNERVALAMLRRHTRGVPRWRTQDLDLTRPCWPSRRWSLGDEKRDPQS